MTGPIVVAQANNPQGPGGGPARVIAVNKPQGQQAITLHLDGNVKLDLSAIANEKITLVHLGDRLIILFDNNATVTIEPFYGDNGQPLPDVTVELGPGRDISGADFAGLFPVTTDPAVLPVGSVIDISVPDSKYSGIYTVMDTGPAVQGRLIDVYMWSCYEALDFGRTPKRSRLRSVRRHESHLFLRYQLDHA